MPAKPAYQVPSMAEIAELPHNGFNVISTFSGCGGSSLGYKMAGYRVLAACEFIPAAQDTYRANSPNTPIIGDDIRDVTAERLLETAGIEPGQLDILDGSPPCNSFSTAGLRDSGWGKVKDYSSGVKQRTDDLFFEFLRIVDGVQPKVVVAENVPGLVAGRARNYFDAIMTRLDVLGYHAKAQVLEAQWLGVPQTRKRLIIVAVRRDLNRPPVFPRPLPYRYSIREAFGGQDALGVNGLLDAESGHNLELKPGTRIRQAWEKLPLGAKPVKKLYTLIRTHPDRPAPTITATTASSPTHGLSPRYFSLAELRRLASFPDDFELTGNHAERSERIGRAVPPVMMRAIASGIRDHILRSQ